MSNNSRQVAQKPISQQAKRAAELDRIAEKMRQENATTFKKREAARQSWARKRAS